MYGHRALTSTKVLAVTESQICYTLIVCMGETVYGSALQLLHSFGVIHGGNLNKIGWLALRVCFPSNGDCTFR
jgi:hypothetical protein